ncbi:MAG: capsular biosynthesis protein, partial [Leptotrichia sp.]|nr:capsular biosynthesis protein [Leptotrichia sp.]
NSIIFSEKNNKMIHSLLELMLIFWKKESEIPHYFFFQILYNELAGKYMPEEKFGIVDDTLPHILFSKWNDRFSEKELNEITEKINIHKLTQKGISKENCIRDSFYDYFNKKFDV